MLPVKNHLLPNVSRFFDDDWNALFDWTNRSTSQQTTTLPAVNIRETADDFTIEMAAPGMQKKDFQIELKDNMLVIRCERQEEAEENYIRKEYSYQSFQRSFNLNHQVVDDANVKATYQAGILSLILPKKEEVKEKPARVIQIS